MEDSNWFLDSLPGAWAAVTALVTAFGPLIVGLVVLYMGARMTQKREHNAWLRDKRIEALVTLLGRANKFTQHARSSPGVALPLLSDLSRSFDEVFLLGPEPLADSVKSYLNYVTQSASDVFQGDEDDYKVFLSESVALITAIRVVGQKFLIRDVNQEL